jgi:uncharacterized protein YbaA (DUF1428 family)
MYRQTGVRFDRDPRAATKEAPMAKKTKGNYVDGFVIPVPRRKVAAYCRMAKACGKIWREHGALDYKECIADDVKKGKRTSFPRSVKLKPSEVVFFSYIVYKSRASRDAVMKKVMSDKRLEKYMDPKSMPFDGKRMFWGGFKIAVRA